MEIVILIALILLHGLFAMSELALMTARKARLQKLVDAGDRSAAAAVKLGEDPTRVLSTIQIGITSIGVLNGIVGEAALAGPLAVWLLDVGVPEAWASYGATGLVVVVITYFSIVVEHRTFGIHPAVASWCPSGWARPTPRPWPDWWRGPSIGWPSPPSPS